MIATHWQLLKTEALRRLERASRRQADPGPGGRAAPARRGAVQRVTLTVPRSPPPALPARPPV